MNQDDHSLLSQRRQRFFGRLGNAARREGRTIWTSLRDPALGVLLPLAMLLFILAYQVVVPFSLQVGQQPDEVLLEGFNAPEESEGRTFRWSMGESWLHLTGMGQAMYRVDLLLSAFRPPDQPVPALRLLAGGQTLLETTAGPDRRVYSVLVPPEASRSGSLDLLLASDVFTPTGDARHLGVALEQVQVLPVGRPVGPAWDVMLWGGLAVLLTVLLVGQLGWPRWVRLGAGLAVALALAALLAWARPFLVPGLPFLPLGLSVAWAALVLLRGVVGSVFERGGAALSPRAERALWTVFTFFLAVRLAGYLYPAVQTWDLCFHYNRLVYDVAQGNVFFTIQSTEWGNQETFYLPSMHLLLVPFWGFFGGRLVPFKLAAVFLDTSAALFVAYIARRLLGQGRAAVLAALLYLALPLSYIIFSWGIVSNILGQWLLLLVLALLVSPAVRLSRARSWLTAAGLLIPSALSHPGAVQLMAVFLGLLLVVAWVVPLPQLQRPAAVRWIGAGLAVGILAVVIYYSFFVGTMLGSLQKMGQPQDDGEPPTEGILVRGPLLDADLGLRPVRVATWAEAVRAGIAEVAAEARAYYHGWPFYLALAALAGLALERRPLAVRIIGLAVLVALFFAVVGLATNLYVRYGYFLLPFVAIGAAWWLSRLPRLGRVGQVILSLVILILVSQGLLFWVQHILYYSAICQ